MLAQMGGPVPFSFITLPPCPPCRVRSSSSGQLGRSGPSLGYCLLSARLLIGVESNAGCPGSGPQHKTQQGTKGKIERFVGTAGSGWGQCSIDDLNLEGAGIVMALIALGNLVGDLGGFFRPVARNADRNEAGVAHRAKDQSAFKQGQCFGGLERRATAEAPAPLLV